MRVDLDKDGAALGIEITEPAAVTQKDSNAVLARHGLEALGKDTLCSRRDR